MIYKEEGREQALRTSSNLPTREKVLRPALENRGYKLFINRTITFFRKVSGEMNCT